MDESAFRLDGNAAAGMLGELFSAEMTLSLATCAHCGGEDLVGRLIVYMHAPGTVFRCSFCGNVVMRIVRGPQRVWLDFAGMRRLIMSDLP